MQFLKTEKKNKINKKLLLTSLPMNALTLCFAADSDSATTTALSNLQKVFSTVYAFFASGYTLVICSVGLIWVGIKWITNRGEPTILKDLGPKIGAFILIGGASGFCQLFFKPTKGTSVMEGTNVFQGLGL